MTLWTIQPQEVYNLLSSEGVFRCDADKCTLQNELHTANSSSNAFRIDVIYLR